MGLQLDHSFFQANDAPPSGEIVATSAMKSLKQRLALDFNDDTHGRIRLVFGRRGFGKSTALAFLMQLIRKEYPGSAYVELNAGLFTTKMTLASKDQAVALFLEELAACISDDKERDITKVVRVVAKQSRKHFILVDNLDRLYSKQADLELVKYLFEQADPILKKLGKKMVIVITAAPEWEAVVKTDDLSYLNYDGRIELQGMTSNELRDAVQARLTARGRKIEDLFDGPFLNAVLAAAGGSPRRIFQTLEQFNGPDQPQPPLLLSHAMERLSGEIEKGIIEEVKEAAARSALVKESKEGGRLAGAVTKLVSFFEMVGNDPGNRSLAVEQVALAAAGGVKESEARFRNAWGLIAEKGGRQRLLLVPPVARLLAVVSERSGLPATVVLRAIANERPETGMVGIEDFDRKLRDSLTGTALAEYEAAFHAYFQLGEARGARSNIQVISDSWTCISGLLFAIHAVSGLTQESDIQDLQRRLREKGTFTQACQDLMEGADRVYAQSGKTHNPVSEDVRSVGDYQRSMLQNPERANLYQQQQVEMVQAKARHAFESMIRQLPASTLRRLRETSVGEAKGLIAEGEGPHIEFKAAFRYNPARPTQPDIAMETRCMEALAAFANARGGCLLIGVSDAGDVIGMKGDIESAGRQVRDKWELLCRSRVDQRLPGLGHRMKVRLHTVDGQQLAIVKIGEPQGHAVLLLPASPLEGGPKFLVRTGNRNTTMEGEQLTRYLAERRMQI